MSIFYYLNKIILILKYINTLSILVIIDNKNKPFLFFKCYGIFRGYEILYNHCGLKTINI